MVKTKQKRNIEMYVLCLTYFAYIGHCWFDFQAISMRCRLNNSYTPKALKLESATTLQDVVGL